MNVQGFVETLDFSKIFGITLHKEMVFSHNLSGPKLNMLIKKNLFFINTIHTQAHTYTHVYTHTHTYK